MEAEIVSPKKISKRKVDFALSKVSNKERRVSVLALNSAQSRRNSKILNPYDNLIISSNGIDKESSHKIKPSQGVVLDTDISNVNMLRKLGGTGENQNFYEGMLAKYKHLNNNNSNTNSFPHNKDLKCQLPTIHTEDAYAAKKDDAECVNNNSTKLKSIIEHEAKNPFKLKETSKFMNLQPFLKGNAKSPSKSRAIQSDQIIKPSSIPISNSESNLVNEKKEVMIKANSDSLKKSSSEPISQMNTKSQKTQANKKKFHFWCCF